GRALLEENEHTHFVAGDLRKPRELFADPTIVKYIDFDRPIALIQCATMHHVPDEEHPHDSLHAYIDMLPSGSYLALTHWHDPDDGGEGSRIAQFIEDEFSNGAMGSGNFRSRTEIEQFFTGLTFVEPGLTLLRDWWPDGPAVNPVD